jgi:hypothetical protein
MTPDELQALVAALPQAGTLDLYRLGCAIRALYSEPQRVLEIRRHLHLGMTVRFFLATTGEMRRGRITALHRHEVSIDELDHSSRWSGVPYAAIDVQPASSDEVEMIDSPRPAPRPVARTRADFRLGDSVTFTDRDGRTLFGKIVKLNPKTASIDVGGGTWRVSYPLLQQVVDL